jgi:spermidine synthase
LLLEFWRDEGPQTAVSVRASQFQHVLYLDGLHQANDGPEMVQLHRTIGHLPLVLHPNPKEALVIGLGGGATSGAVSQHRGTRVQIVELSESVRKAAPFFAHVNYDVLNQPNVRIRVDDGRNFLLLTGHRYDVVMADVIRPQHAGSAALYSLEYYTLARQALQEDGVMIQWIDQRLPENQYQMLLRTFLRAFPYATAWADGAFFVGSESPYAIDRRLLGERLASRTPGAAARSGVATPEDLLRLFTATDEELRRYAGDGPIVTDDHPYIEFFRSLPADPHAPDPAVFRRDPSPLLR